MPTVEEWLAKHGKKKKPAPPKETIGLPSKGRKPAPTPKESIGEKITNVIERHTPVNVDRAKRGLKESNEAIQGVAGRVSEFAANQAERAFDYSPGGYIANKIAGKDNAARKTARNAGEVAAGFVTSPVALPAGLVLDPIGTTKGLAQGVYENWRDPVKSVEEGKLPTLVSDLLMLAGAAHGIKSVKGRIKGKAPAPVETVHPVAKAVVQNLVDEGIVKPEVAAREIPEIVKPVKKSVAKTEAVKAVEPAPEVANAKDDWELTSDEYINQNAVKSGSRGGLNIGDPNNLQVTHSILVEKALQRGENVPIDVILSQPEVAKKYRPEEWRASRELAKAKINEQLRSEWDAKQPKPAPAAIAEVKQELGTTQGKAEPTAKKYDIGIGDEIYPHDPEGIGMPTLTVLDVRGDKARLEIEGDGTMIAPIEKLYEKGKVVSADEIAASQQETLKSVNDSYNRDMLGALDPYISDSVGKGDASVKLIRTYKTKTGKPVTKAVKANLKSYDISEIADQMNLSPESFVDMASERIRANGGEFKIKTPHGTRSVGELFDMITAYELKLLKESYKPAKVETIPVGGRVQGSLLPPEVAAKAKAWDEAHPIKAAVRDVTPEGYGPTGIVEPPDPTRLWVEPEKVQKLRNSILEDKTMLRSKLPESQRAAIERKLARTQAELDALLNFESGYRSGEPPTLEPVDAGTYTKPYNATKNAFSNSTIKGKEGQRAVEGGIFGEAQQDMFAGVAARTNEAIPEAQLPTPGLTIQHVGDMPKRTPPTKKYVSPDAAIEQGFRDTAGGVKGVGFVQHVKEGLTNLFHSMTRTHTDLPRSPEFAIANDSLRYLGHQKGVASNKTLQLLQDITLPLKDTNAFDVFRRKVVIDDLVATANRGETLPFGWTPEQVKAEAARIDAALAGKPDINEALMRRTDAWEAVKSDYIKAQKDMGFNVEEMLIREDYFRHQVLDYMNGGGVKGTGKKLKTPTSRGFLKERGGSSKAISTNYLQAEWEVMAQMIHDTEVSKVLKKLEGEYDISRRVRDSSRDKNFENLVGGPDVVRRIRKLEADLAELYTNPEDAGESSTRLAAKGIIQELDELDPTRYYKKQIAIGFSKLEKLDLLDWDGSYEGGGDIFRQLADLMKNEEMARPGAGMIFKAIAQKEAMIKDRLGSNYLKWKQGPDPRVLPEAYTTWQPREGNLFYTVKSIPENTVMDLLDGIGFNPDQVTEVTAMGGKRKEWVIPEALAKTLDDVGSKRVDPARKTLNARILNLWKQYVLLNPKRLVKYNLRNLSGDAEMLFIGNPSAFKEVPGAVKELYQTHKTTRAPEGDLADWVQRGGQQGLLQAQEMGQLDQLAAFIRLSEKKPGLKTAITGLPRKYWEGARLSTDFREGILRYAAYKDYLKQVMSNPEGKPKNFGASIPEEVMAIKDLKDRAYKLSNELLGAYDQISETGRGLREGVYPFWSWAEVNFGRNIRMIKNAAREGNVGGTLTRKIAVGVPKAAYSGTKLALKASAMWAMLQAYNNLRFPDEERDLPIEARSRPHIIFGRSTDGTINYLSRLGSVSDFLEWFGLDAPQQKVTDFLNGRTTVKDIAKDAVQTPANKLAQGLNPIWKIGTELTTGKTLYPNVFEPGKLRDKPDYLAKQLSAENEFRVATKRPHESYSKSLVRGFVDTADPVQSAYYEILDRKYTFLEERGKPGGESANSPKSQALYYYKRAKALGDKKAEQRYKKQYMELGGTKQGIAQSVRTGEPLYGLGKNKAEFLKSLTADERRKLKLANQYFKKISKGVPKGGSSSAIPSMPSMPSMGSKIPGAPY